MPFDPIAALMEIGSKVIDRVFPDPTAAAQAKLELMKLQQSGELAQMTAQTDINKAEASSESIFVAGWRPFVGWVCGVGCAWNWIGLPVGKFVCALMGHDLALQQADLSEMLPLLFGLLGLGYFRTHEKVKGVAGAGK